MARKAEEEGRRRSGLMREVPLAESSSGSDKEEDEDGVEQQSLRAAVARDSDARNIGVVLFRSRKWRGEEARRRPPS
jgi:hypothetical protein